MWCQVINNLKEIYDLGKFWKAIKQWETEDCVDSARFLFKMSVFWKKVVTSAIQNKLKMFFKDLSFKCVVFVLSSSVLALCVGIGSMCCRAVCWHCSESAVNAMSNYDT